MMQDEFLKFLIRAKKVGYATGGEKSALPESDASKSTALVEGDFSFHDNWFGGEPFGGREVVHYKGKPYWIMVYYGSDTQISADLIPFLLKALSQPSERMPLRGPELIEDGKYKYVNVVQGTIEKFFGQEMIYYDAKEVYRANYIGGLVDQKIG